MKKLKENKKLEANNVFWKHLKQKEKLTAVSPSSPVNTPSTGVCMLWMPVVQKELQTPWIYSECMHGLNNSVLQRKPLFWTNEKNLKYGK